jgi:hypothetical protein
LREVVGQLVGPVVAVELALGPVDVGGPLVRLVAGAKPPVVAVAVAAMLFAWQLPLAVLVADEGLPVAVGVAPLVVAVGAAVELPVAVVVDAIAPLGVPVSRKRVRIDLC